MPRIPTIAIALVLVIALVGVLALSADSRGCGGTTSCTEWDPNIPEGGEPPVPPVPINPPDIILPADGNVTAPTTYGLVDLWMTMTVAFEDGSEIILVETFMFAPATITMGGKPIDSIKYKMEASQRPGIPVAIDAISPLKLNYNFPETMKTGSWAFTAASTAIPQAPERGVLFDSFIPASMIDAVLTRELGEGVHDVELIWEATLIGPFNAVTVTCPCFDVQHVTPIAGGGGTGAAPAKPMTITGLDAKVKVDY